MRTVLVFIILLSSLNGYSQKRISQEKLIQDFDYAVHELRMQHQGFYQYLDEKNVEAKLADLKNKIDKPMTKLEFYRLIRELLTLMNEGHGSVNLPKWTMIKIGLSKSFLPLGVRFFNKELIVTQNFGKEVEGLTKGVKLISVNDRPISEITQAFKPLIATDGFNQTSVYEWIGSINFSLLYRLVYGKTKDFKLEILKHNESKSKIIHIPAIRFTAFKSKNAKFKPWHFDFTKFVFQQLNDSIAYLSIPDFGDGEINYQKFYENQFKKIDSLKIKHLIIDIQANGGGEEGNENLLFSYLVEEKIRKYRRVTMLPVPYQKNKNDSGYKFDKWELKDSIAERGEFTCFSNYFSELGYAPPNPEYIYRNKVYVLISGFTFSGGAEFASMVKMTNRGIFIGEETGGAYEGNVSGYTETVKLPNTKISIDIPTVHFQINVTPSIKGRGILPDYKVPQTWEDYLEKRNAKLEFVKELIN